jgi:hypothetical protein
LLVCAWDGTEIDTADTADNREGFRRHRGKNREAVGVPKIRLLVLLACGSRQILGAVTGTLAQGEVTLARQLVARLRAGQLLLADLDPSRISFTAARDTAEHTIATTPQQALKHLAWISNDLRQHLITHHIHTRVFPRTLKNTHSRYPHRSKTPQLTSTNTTYQTQIIKPANPPPTPQPPPQSPPQSPATPQQPRAA